MIGIWVVLGLCAAITICNSVAIGFVFKILKDNAEKLTLLSTVAVQYLNDREAASAKVEQKMPKSKILTGEFLNRRAR